MKTDTIAAVATALSDAGIGIIRISGSEAIKTADKIFVNAQGKHILQDVQSHTIHYGYIVTSMSEKSEEQILNIEDGLQAIETDADWKDNILDEVMVSVFRAPRSYTTEDTVEINCHGGVLLLQKVLQLVCRSGARMAEPGEFTKRAFLNGRMDLSEAEAVMDLIHSQNEFAIDASVKQLRGNLYRMVKKLREEIIYEIAFIESALDDPEHISLDGYPERLLAKSDAIRQEIGKLIDSADNGKLLKEGIATVIVGKPNAGKSSLLNILVGEERAIVTEIAGTTRDILQETVKLRGISLNVIDTAGIRDTADKVEKIGVDRAWKYVDSADLVLYVVDTSVPLDENDREICKKIADKKVIVLLNKSDLDAVVTEENILKLFEETLSRDNDLAEVKITKEYINSKSTDKNYINDTNVNTIKLVKTSTKNDAETIGIAEFEEIVEEMFFSGKLYNSQEIVITNLRHKEALQNSYDSIVMLQNSIKNDMPEDFYSIDLMSAYIFLGIIIGEEVEDDLVEEIFSKFCMGK